jgi:hypothetical protein
MIRRYRHKKIDVVLGNMILDDFNLQGFTPRSRIGRAAATLVDTGASGSFITVFRVSTASIMAVCIFAMAKETTCFLADRYAA